MIGPDSRYATAARLKLRAGAREVEAVVPPILPHPEDHAAGLRHRVSDADRVDILAARVYGQATNWWMIAEANTAAHPDQITSKPGTEIEIPAPGGASLLPRGGG